MSGAFHELKAVAFRRDRNSLVGLMLATIERSEERRQRGRGPDRESVHRAVDALLDSLDTEAKEQ